MSDRKCPLLKDVDLGGLGDNPPVQSGDRDGIGKRFDQFFKITQRGSNITTEILAGITTFLSMAYILTVNPATLTLDGNEARWPSLFIATCVGSIVGSMLMAVLAKMPYAQAPGMGLNSAIGALVAYPPRNQVWSYDNAMAMCFIYSIIVLVVSILPVGREREKRAWIWLRDKLYEGIPECVRRSISVGIGLYIAFIGLQNSKFIVNNDNVLLSLADFTRLWDKGKAADNLEKSEAKEALVCLIALISIAILRHYKVPGFLILGVIIGTIFAIPLKVVDFDLIAGKSEYFSWAFWNNFKNYFRWDPNKGGIFFGFVRGFKFPNGSAMAVVMNIISLGMADLFDTMGTVVGCANNAGLIDDEGKPQKYGKVMLSDSIAAVVASILGTSSVTTHVESTTGISVGGMTGLVAVVVSIGFFLAIFFLPIFAFIPLASASAALIYVGVLMISGVRKIVFDEEDLANSMPAFMTIAMIPFTYSITKGIGLGMLTYCFIQLFQRIIDFIMSCCKDTERPETLEASEGREGLKRPKWQPGIVTVVVGLLFLVYFLVPT